MTVDFTLNDSNSFINISSNDINRSKWFIGSALMGQNFEELPSGQYFYEQDTIWSRVLDMNQINPYWEIHNRTKNFLMKNQSIEQSMDILIEYIRKLNIVSSNDDIYFITDDSQIIHYIQSREYGLLKLHLPFYIEKDLVGSYLKVFIRTNGQLHPLVDCTIFKKSDEDYFEININLFYHEMILFHRDGIIPQKYKTFTSIFGKSEPYETFYLNQDKIKFLSLFDCVLFLSDQDSKIDSSYKGHTTKKIVKDFVFYSLVNNSDLSKMYSYLKIDFIDFIKNELIKIEKVYPKIIRSKKTDLAATYGISEKTLRYLTGAYVSNSFSLSDGCRFFTDISFLPGYQDFDNFKSQIIQIIESKK